MSRQLMLSAKEFSIEGIDLSEEMVKLAGKNVPFEKTSFSEEELFFYYHSSEKVEAILKDNRLLINKLTNQGYLESDGFVTTDVFVFASKGNHSHNLKVKK